MELTKINSTLLTDILSDNVLLPGESGKKLNKIKEEILSELSPSTIFERLLAGKIISDFWKLQRLLKFEARILQSNQDDRESFHKNDTYFLKQKMEGKKIKRFRRTFKQVKYSPQVEEIQKHISIVETGLLKSISEYQNIQKNRLHK
jgi:hypothetical protein